MMVRDQATFFYERTEARGTVWCIALPALEEIAENVGDDAFASLQAAVERRVGEHLPDALAYWRAGCLFIHSNEDNGDDWARAHQVAAALLEKFSLMFTATSNVQNIVELEQKIFLTPQIGLAVHDQATLIDAQQYAELAADEIASDNGKLVNVYRATTTELKPSPFFLQQAFLSALREKRFQLVYQPQVEFETGLIHGFEALLRPPADNGPLSKHSPPDLIDLAASMNLLTELTAFVLSQSLKDRAIWNTLSPNVPFTVSVNVSPKTLTEGWETLLALIPETVGNGGLVIELTETLEGFNGSLPELNEKLLALKSMGVGISIDDFGKGLSNFDRISAVHCDEIKLDRSLISRITVSETGADLVLTMVRLANDQGIRVVAEGIEVQGQWDFLANSKCQIAQGFLISKPKSTQEIMLMLSKKSNDNHNLASYCWR